MRDVPYPNSRLETVTEVFNISVPESYGPHPSRRHAERQSSCVQWLGNFDSCLKYSVYHVMLLLN